MTVTYEVTAIVREDLCDAYETYMRTQHIPDVLRTGQFESAILARSSGGRYRIRYEAASRESLDRYLAENARDLRQDFTSHFPDGIELSREEWDVIESFDTAGQLDSR
jgi:hypothetical protein